MKRGLLLFLFILPCVFLYAQEETDSTVLMETDSAGYWEGSGSYDSTYEDSDGSASYVQEPVNPRDVENTVHYKEEEVKGGRFDAAKWKDNVGEMNYDENPQKKKDEKPKEKKKGSSPWFSIDPAVLKIVAFVLVFVLFAFILYYVSKNTTLSERISKLKPSDISAPVENIEEFDSDSLLKQALASGDLRLAIRIRYLMLLKQLNEVGLIRWKKDKTNRDYLSELFGKNSCYENVRDLTLAYELVWYGERAVNHDSFQRLSGEFENVDKQINQARPTE